MYRTQSDRNLQFLQEGSRRQTADDFERELLNAAIERDMKPLRERMAKNIRDFEAQQKAEKEAVAKREAARKAAEAAREVMASKLISAVETNGGSVTFETHELARVIGVPLPSSWSAHDGFRTDVLRS